MNSCIPPVRQRELEKAWRHYKIRGVHRVLCGHCGLSKFWEECEPLAWEAFLNGHWLHHEAPERIPINMICKECLEKAQVT